MNRPMTPIDDPIVEIDLAGLQRRLDALAVGEALTIAIATYRRIFGLNDAAQARLANFAKGHGCVTDAAPSMITFRKTKATPR